MPIDAQASEASLAQYKGIEGTEPLVAFVCSQIAALPPAVVAALDPKSKHIADAVTAKTYTRGIKSLREAARAFAASCARHHVNPVDADTFYVDYTDYNRNKGAVSAQANVLPAALAIGGQLHAAGVHSHATDALGPTAAASTAAESAASTSATAAIEMDGGDGGSGGGEEISTSSGSASGGMFERGSTLLQDRQRAPVVSTAGEVPLSSHSARVLQAYVQRKERGGAPPSYLASFAAGMARTSSGSSGGGLSPHESSSLAVPIELTSEELLGIVSIQNFSTALEALGVTGIVVNSSLEKLVSDGSTIKDLSRDDSIEQLYRHLVTVLTIPSGVAIKICRLIFAMKHVDHPFF